MVDYPETNPKEHRFPALMRPSRVFILIFVNLMIVLLIFLITQAAYHSILEETRSKVRGLAATVALGVSAEDLQEVQVASDIDTPAFQRVYRYYQQVRKANPDIRYVYCVRPKPEAGPTMFEFIVDADPFDYDDDGDGTISEDEEGSPPGSLYDTADAPVMRQGMVYSIAEPHFYTDKWGSALTGYAPIINPRTGVAVAAQCVDIMRPQVIMKAEVVVYTAIAAGLGLMFLVSFSLIVYFERTHAFEVMKLLGDQLEENNIQLSSTINQLNQRQFEINNDLRLAQELQKRFLPKEFPENCKASFAGYYRACSVIGGDLYDLIELDERTLVFYIADVSGHGVTAALETAVLKVSCNHICQQAYRSMKTAEGSPCDHASLARHILNHINGEVLLIERPNSFISFQLAILELDSGEVTLANAGHLPPLLVRHSEDLCSELFVPSNIVLGLLRDFDFEITRHALVPGDRLVLYTDGLVERVNNKGAEYGLNALMNFLDRNALRSLDQVVHMLVESNDHFAEQCKAIDDIAILMFEWRAQSRK